MKIHREMLLFNSFDEENDEKMTMTEKESKNMTRGDKKNTRKRALQICIKQGNCVLALIFLRIFCFHFVPFRFPSISISFRFH